MSQDGESVTTTSSRNTIQRELRNERQDLHAFVQQQGVSLTRLMDEEKSLLQKLDSERSIDSILLGSGNNTKPSTNSAHGCKWDKENYANKLYHGDNAEEAMQMGEI